MDSDSEYCDDVINCPGYKYNLNYYCENQFDCRMKMICNFFNDIHVSSDRTLAFRRSMRNSFNRNIKNQLDDCLINIDDFEEIILAIAEQKYSDYGVNFIRRLLKSI